MNLSCSFDVKGAYYSLMGTLQAKEKQNAQAIGYFSKAAASSFPESRLYARYGLATLYADMGESHAALVLLDEIVQELSNEKTEHKGPEKELLYRVLYNRGLCLYTLEEFEKAAASFRSALLVDSSRWNAKRNLELSLLAHVKKRNSAVSAGAVSAEKKDLPNPVLFDYIRQKEMDRWKNQQWKGTEESAIDY